MRKTRRFWYWLVAISSLLVVFSHFIVAHILIVDSASENIKESAEYVIILGARVRGETPSLSLQYRIDAAARYLLKNTETRIIATGGLGEGAAISEAQAIKNGLQKYGIEASRINIDDQSRSTLQNLINAKMLIGDGRKKAIIVSSEYHIFRAKALARYVSNNQWSVEGLPARTPDHVLAESYIREYFAVIKLLYFGKSSFS